MEYRQGICSSCQNTFRVPATFQLPKAKCPKCGGVVEIGPVQTAASPAAKARPAEGTKQAEGTKPPEVAKPSEPVRVLELKERPAAQEMTTRPIRESAGEREPARAAVEPGGAGARVQKHKVGQKTRKARRRALVGKKKKSSLPILVGLLLVVAGGAFAVKKLGNQSGPEAPPQAAAPVAKPDLSHIPDASKHPETTDTEWAEMNELMAGYIKPPFDRNAERSGDLLARKGLRAVPAILNGWKRVDFSTSDGSTLGWKIQTLLLQDRCGGTNFGWRRDTRAEDIAFNTQVIENWFKAWSHAGDDAAKWEEIAKANQPAAEPAESK